MPITAVDSITPAVEHAKQQLFKPFRIAQWTKLAFVGLLAGELGSNGCNRSNFHVPVHPGAPPNIEFPHGGFPHLEFPSVPGVDHAMLAAFIVAAIVAGLAIGVILMYVSSVMRFVLFDSIIARECHLRWSWSRRLGAGWRYFVWKLGYLLLTFAAVVVIVAIPLSLAFAAGWFREPKEHLPPLILWGAFVFAAFLVFIVATSLILVLTKDFVIPQMALENIDVMEGWRRLWPMMKAEKGAYAAYIVMKIVLAIVAAILTGIATVILGVIIAIPSMMLGLLAVITGKSAGLTWNIETIALAVAIGLILLSIFLYLVSLVYVPAIVFFPAYSLYFFAGRYPPLQAVLYPPAVGPPGAPGMARA
ncbi:MAG TPA: hypothetical protein VMG31_06730 [Verrucomicrobiae bacterium]|nr:hypothetical protein [Verrucomicrobiae bacterium]